jgi:predicted aspartyl protease
LEADDFRAFTVEYHHKSNILQSKASIGAAFDPSHSPAPVHTEFDAIWDTGATGSVITQKVVDKCGLHPTGVVEVYTASGKEFFDTYLVSILLPNNVGFPAVRVTEGKINGADVLVGMDLIGSGDFAVTNVQSNTVFTYRVPSMTRIDFVEEANRMKGAPPGRNAPCPCGSGKKYKKCHGRQ